MMKRLAIIVLVCLLFGVVGHALGAEDVASFYKGEVLSWIVPYNPGGGYDTYSRSLGKFLEKHTGATVVIRNTPGAGGLVGANKLYEAKPDGRTIGILNVIGLAASAIGEKRGVNFDLKKFSWLGRVAADVQVLTLRRDFPVDEARELLKLKKPLRVGANGKGSSNYFQAVVIQQITAIPMEIIIGYDTSAEIMLSMARGEIDALCGSYGPRVPHLKSGEVKMGFLLTGPKPSEYPNVVTLKELVASKSADVILEPFTALHDCGRGLAGPPGMPSDRLEFLRQAFRKAMNDPEAIKQFKKLNLPLGYLSSTELQSLLMNALDAPPRFKKLVKDAM